MYRCEGTETVESRRRRRGAGWDGGEVTMNMPEKVRGDGPCQRCGTPDNIVWFTEDVFWNHVMRAPESKFEDGIICIPCFAVLAHDMGFRPTGWRLLAEWPWRMVTPAPTEAPEPAPPQAPRFWLIVYEDQSVPREVFTDEASARARYAQRLTNWNCSLFVQVTAPDGSALQAQPKDHARALAEKGAVLADRVLGVESAYDRLNREDLLSMATLGGALRDLISARVAFLSALADYEREASEKGGEG
jgi:hypothetical protein